MPTARQKVQRSILRRKGLKPERYHGLKSPELPTDDNKTLAMRLLEVHFDAKIEDLLFYGNLAATARYLGIDPSTVSKWRLKLGLPRAGTPHVS